MLILSWLLHCMQFRTPTLREGVGIPTSVNLIKIIPDRLTQTLVPLLVLDFIKVTIEGVLRIQLV